jgi:hypothetical protein
MNSKKSFTKSLETLFKKNIKKYNTLVKNEKKNDLIIKKEVSLVLNQIIKTIDIVPKNKRKNTDFNGFELLFCLKLIDKNISNKKDIENINFEYFNKYVVGCDESSFTSYKDDILSRNSNIINKWLINMNTYDLFKQTFIKIYLEGKKIKSHEIKELNKNIHDVKQKKADVYIQLQNNNIIGISIKQDANATKSNYSIEDIIQKIHLRTNLEPIPFKSTRIQYLADNGFHEFKEEDRPNVNKLFYPNVSNCYFDLLKKYIHEYNSDIVQYMINCLYPKDLPYMLYEFDGIKLIQLNNIIINSTLFAEHLPYYYTSKGILRNCAKLFYQLKINDTIFRVEGRWKGNIFTSSPQFLIHNDIM